MARLSAGRSPASANPATQRYACASLIQFGPPRLFAAYLNTLRWNCVTSTNPHLFQSPFRVGIRLDSYQIEPLAKALSMPRVNLFIADDVGLGKTIEAGLIARELLIRKKVNYIVVACPPSRLSQWQDELSTRFGLHFEILYKRWMQTIRHQRGFSANPFAAHSRFLISHDRRSLHGPVTRLPRRIAPGLVAHPGRSALPRSKSST